MPVLSIADVRRQLASGRLGPLYLILGADESGKTELAGQFLELIEPDLRPFNVDRLYGGETTAAAIMDAARTLPLIVPRRVVLVLHAERLLTPKRDTDAASKDLALLERYIKAPVESTVLVLVATELDRRRALTRLLLSKGAVVECAGPADAAEAVRWVRDRLAAEGLSIEPRAARLVADRAGADVNRLRSDVGRLVLYAAGKNTVSIGDVAEIVSGPASQDDWAVTRAIERRSAPEALRELALLVEEGVVPYMILGQVAWFVRTKLPAERLDQAVDAVFRTDLALKTSAGDPRALLERLVVELCGL